MSLRIRKFIASVLCMFIPSRKIRHRVRRSIVPRKQCDCFLDNRVVLYDSAGVETRLYDSTVPGLDIRFIGKCTGNTIRIHRETTYRASQIQIFGNNAYVDVGHVQFWREPGLTIHISADDIRVVVSDGTSFNGACCIYTSYKSDVHIGTDCMFAENVEILSTDYHPILDAANKVINVPRGVRIGNHCWIAANVSILKNAVISDGSVVGRCSVVSARYSSPNVVIAGNPARVVKSDVHWVRGTIGEYIASHPDAA